MALQERAIERLKTRTIEEAGEAHQAVSGALALAKLLAEGAESRDWTDDDQGGADEGGAGGGEAVGEDATDEGDQAGEGEAGQGEADQEGEGGENAGAPGDGSTGGEA